MACGKVAEVKAVFGRCLLHCFSMELWVTYLRFIRQVSTAAHVWGLRVAMLLKLLDPFSGVLLLRCKTLRVFPTQLPYQKQRTIVQVRFQSCVPLWEYLRAHCSLRRFLRLCLNAGRFAESFATSSSWMFVLNT